MAIRELLISNLGPLGDGISAPSEKGPRIFIERTIAGDRVRAHTYLDEKGVWRGDLVEILEASPDRQEPPCPHYDFCGNCSLQHLREDAYRSWKIRVLSDALRKNDVTPRVWKEPVFLGTRNRRRITFNAIKKNGKVFLGYYKRRTQLVSNIDSCLITESSLFDLRKKIIPLISPLISEGKSLDIFLQQVGEYIDMMFTGPIDQSRLDPKKIDELLKSSPITRLSSRESTKSKPKIIARRREISVKFGSLVVDLPPGAFMQPTLDGENALVAAVTEALPKSGAFADLFCGCGTFSGAMLERGTVEAYELSIDAVKSLARAVSLDTINVYQRDLFENPLRRDELNRYDAVLFDPPRAGCEEQAREMAKSRCPKLISVSCNPATFARDARLLCRGGYQLDSVQLIDQFAWSHHMEVVGVFTQKRKDAKRR